MSAYSEISANDLFTLMENQALLLVDVRNDDEVARGIISGAIQQIPDFLGKELAEFPKHSVSGIRNRRCAVF